MTTPASGSRIRSPAALVWLVRSVLLRLGLGRCTPRELREAIGLCEVLRHVGEGLADPGIIALSRAIANRLDALLEDHVQITSRELAAMHGELDSILSTLGAKEIP